MKDFRDLKVWSKAHGLTLSIYRATAHFPVEERYGLQSQMRRASVSISANIAEGCGRHGDADFARFLQMALGSASEIEYLLLLSKDLDLLDAEPHRALTELATEVKRMLASFIKKLRAES